MTVKPHYSARPVAVRALDLSTVRSLSASGWDFFFLVKKF
jgi:hypothetical protein